MYGICCMKSKFSYSRLKTNYSDKCNWEEYIDEIQTVQDKIVFNDYDFAVVDEKLPWKEQVIELFTKKGIETILFEGDFEDVVIKIDALIEKNKLNSVAEEPIEEIIPEETIQSTEEKTESEQTIRYVDKIVEVTKEVPVEVPVYKQIYAGIQNKLIGVLNLSSNAGSTFITLNLAKMISSYGVLTSIIELSLNPVIFNLMGLEKKFGDNFYSYHHAIVDKKKIEKDRESIFDDVIFIVPDTRKYLAENWDYSLMMKLIYSSKKASINIVDIGNNFEDDSIQGIIDEFDILIVVIDPMQNNFNVEVLREVKKFGRIGKVQYVINRWNSNSDKNKIVSEIGSEDFVYVPFIDIEVINKAINSSVFPYSIDTVKQSFDKPFSKLIRELIPTEILKNEVQTDTNQKEEIKKIERKVEYLALGTNEIALLGVSPCVGVTHTAIMFSYALRDKYKVAVLEMNSNGSFYEIKKIIGDESENNYFKNKGVDFFWNVKYSQFIAQHKDNYDFIILDFGSYDDIEDIDDFIRADKRIIIGHAIDWKLKEIKKFYESTKKYDLNSSWYYIIPLMPDKELGDIRKLIKNKVISIPYNINPFSPSDEIREIFNDILGVKKEGQSKKGFFKFLKR